MTPEAYFEQHPRQYWLALAGPTLAAVYAVAKMRGAPARGQACRWAALAVLTAVQAVGLLRIRPRQQTPWPAPKGDAPGPQKPPGKGPL